MACFSIYDLTPISTTSGLWSICTGITRKYQQIDIYIYQCEHADEKKLKKMWLSENNFVQHSVSHATRNIFVTKTNKMWSQTHKNPIKNAHRSLPVYSYSRFRARLFIDVLWSLAGKGLTSRLSFVMCNFEVVTFPLVSWVRCGAWLYLSLIFASFLLWIPFKN